MTGAADYDAWGNILVAAGDTTSFGYAGQFRYYADPETEFYLLKARYYDPEVGRFTQRDPIEDGVNRYIYVRSSPTGALDPSGLVCIPFVSNCIDKALEKACELHGRNDKLAHCYMACRAARCIGGGLVQTYFVPWFMCRSENDPYDKGANRRGGACARDQIGWPFFNKYPDCYTCCKQAVKGLPNEPGEIDCKGLKI